MQPLVQGGEPALYQGPVTGQTCLARGHSHKARRAGTQPSQPLPSQPLSSLPCLRPRQDGWNPAALIATGAGVLPTLPGFLSTLGVLHGVPPVLLALYDCAWFVGVGVSSLVYCALMAAAGQQQAAGGGRGEGDGGGGGGGVGVRPAPA